MPNFKQMKNKKSFILYADLMHTVEKLPDEVAGKLFKIILNYVNDKDEEIEDLLLSVTFESIKQQLKRDLDSWKDKKVERSESGRKGNLKRHNKDLYEEYLKGSKTLEEAENIAKDRRTSLSDNSDRSLSLPIAPLAVNVNDSVSVNVNDSNKEIYKEDFLDDPVYTERTIGMYKKFMIYIKDYFPTVAILRDQLDIKQYHLLLKAQKHQDELKNILADMEEWPKIETKKSVYRTALSWMLKNQKQKQAV